MFFHVSIQSLIYIIKLVNYINKTLLSEKGCFF